MRNIDRFILHVVHNLFPLNEYSQGALDQILAHYKKEAEEGNYDLSEPQLKKYIELFDKNKAKWMKKIGTDLVEPGPGGKLKVIVPLYTLVQLASSLPGSNIDDEKDQNLGPGVIFPKPGDPIPQEGEPGHKITIYDGSREDNCIRYGQGESWCITRGSFGNYRYRADKGYPTFYLAKNDNLEKTDWKNSFVAIQVRGERPESNRYVYTDRSNSPYESSEMSFEELTKRVPWLKTIPNLKDILVYKPLTSQEKNTQVYRSNAASINDWIYFPNLDIKQQYLVVRAGKQKFNDISDERFVRDYLPDYPKLARFLAITPGVIDTELLLQYLDELPRNDQSSVVDNLRSKVSLDLLSKAKAKLSFLAKKLITHKNKWDLKSDQKVYVTEDGQSIILLTIGENNIRIDRYIKEKNFDNIKLNKNTSKYLLDYPNLDEIPLKNLIKLAEDEIVDKEFINNILNKAKDDPNSSLIVKPVEDGEIILDSNTFLSYKVGSDGKITSVPFDNEEVQQAFDDAKNNEGFQQNALNLFKTRDNLPRNIDKKSLARVINSIPYNQRIINTGGDIPGVVLVAAEGADNPFFIMNSSPIGPFYNLRSSYGSDGDFYGYNRSVNESEISAYHAYLRSINKSFNDNELLNIFRNSAININGKIAAVRNNMPVNETNVYKAVTMGGNDVVLVNTNNSRESLMLSRFRNNLKQLNLPQGTANQLLGRAPAAGAAQPAAGAPRRGRPAGVPNAPRAAAPAPAAAGNINVTEAMEEMGLDAAFLRMPRADYRKLAVTNASRVDPNGDRGATRRNNILDGRGRVGRVISVDASKIYIIRLANQQIIASINIQPGNRNYILTGNNNGNVVIPLDSPSELLQALRRANLVEIHRYIVNEYFDRNPKHISEFKQLLRKHVNEKNNQTMNKSKLKEVIRQLVDKILAEAPYKPYEEEEDDDVETLPRTRPTISPDEDDDDDDLNIGQPIPTPAKAMLIKKESAQMTPGEKDTLNQITKRFKSRK